MVKLQPFYVVWQDGKNEQYWMQYKTLEEAVSAEGGEDVDVYEVQPKFLGCYNCTVKSVLSKKKGKK